MGSWALNRWQKQGSLQILVWTIRTRALPFLQVSWEDRLTGEEKVPVSNLYYLVRPLYKGPRARKMTQLIKSLLCSVRIWVWSPDPHKRVELGEVQWHMLITPALGGGDTQLPRAQLDGLPTQPLARPDWARGKQQTWSPNIVDSLWQTRLKVDFWPPHTHAHMQTCTNTHTHMNTNIHVYTCAHICMHTHTHTHKEAKS